MLAIICMIIGAINIARGAKLMINTIQNKEEEQPIKTKIDIVFAIIFCLIGTWLLSNAIELYYYIIHNNLMQLFW
jgi:uncharacterized membrane protein HdeD (DUF308 family)